MHVFQQRMHPKAEPWGAFQFLKNIAVADEIIRSL
jgi:hypothetical protein